ncbi:MAG TPA: hypothetical protein VJK52_01045 [Candidatus Nanoarchaeia archaeon]|nr:hypothetical protein [Candidatus Nanoarchaeia archaeon]
MNHSEVCTRTTDGIDRCFTALRVTNEKIIAYRQREAVLLVRAHRAHDRGNDQTAEEILDALYNLARPIRRSGRSLSVKIVHASGREYCHDFRFVLKRFSHPALAALECRVIGETDVYSAHAIGKYVLHEHLESPDAFQVLSWLPNGPNADQMAYVIAQNALSVARSLHGAKVPSDIQEPARYRDKLQEIFAPCLHMPGLQQKLQEIASILEDCARVPFRDASLWNMRINVRDLLSTLARESEYLRQQSRYPLTHRQCVQEIVAATGRDVALEALFAELGQHITHYDFSTVRRHTFFIDDAVHVLESPVLERICLYPSLWQTYRLEHPRLPSPEAVDSRPWHSLQGVYRHLRTAFHCAAGDLPAYYRKYRAWHLREAFNDLQLAAGEYPDLTLNTDQPAEVQIAKRMLSLKL